MMTAAQMMGLDSSHLQAIDDVHSLHKDIVNDFVAMQAAAHADGVDLQICSSYRDFVRQASIWDRKWLGQLPLYRLNGSEVAASELDDEQRLHAILLWSALPGASRHHWGTDFDVYDKQEVHKREHAFELVVSEYEGNGPCAKLAAWLAEHAAEYGFYRPYATYVGGVAAEPWHLSHQRSAEGILANFDKAALASHLKASNIQGKALVLLHLDDIFSRYTLNKCA